jgi:hypothetical protein
MRNIKDLPNLNITEELKKKLLEEINSLKTSSPDIPPEALNHINEFIQGGNAKFELISKMTTDEIGKVVKSINHKSFNDLSPDLQYFKNFMSTIFGHFRKNKILHMNSKNPLEKTFRTLARFSGYPQEVNLKDEFFREISTLIKSFNENFDKKTEAPVRRQQTAKSSNSVTTSGDQLDDLFAEDSLVDLEKKIDDKFEEELTKTLGLSATETLNKLAELPKSSGIVRSGNGSRGNGSRGGNGPRGGNRPTR